MKKIRVLQIFTKKFELGGEETVAFNIFKNIDKEKFQVDFFSQYNGENEFYRKYIVDGGGNFFGIEPKKDSYIGRISYFFDVYKFVKNSEYDILHIHSGNILGMVFGMLAVKLARCKCVILHSHNTGIKNIKNVIMKFLFTPLISSANYYLACSSNAAEFRYPKSVTSSNRCEILKNGINYEKYLYNVNIREEYRKKLNINNDEFAFGFIGRIVDQKDPIKLIGIFNKLNEIKKDIKLFIVGSGDLENEVKSKVKNLNLESKVIFLNERTDVNCLLQAFDALIVPSKYEGLGIVAIEAQAAGIYTFCSKALPKEANISNLYCTIDTSLDDEKIAKVICDKISEVYVRVDMTNEIKSSKYDIESTIKRLEEIYKEVIR